MEKKRKVIGHEYCKILYLSIRNDCVVYELESESCFVIGGSHGNEYEYVLLE
jgi:hypothetical protein